MRDASPGPLDPGEARLKKELELIKQRWLAKHEEDINYFGEAFYNQYNLITLGGLGLMAGVGLALAGPPLGILVGSLALAWEVSWLGIAPFSERFRRSVRAERNREALEARHEKRDKLIEELPEAAKARHQAARALADEVRKQAEEVESGELGLLEETLAKLDYLLEQYAQMLLALHRLEKSIDSGEEQELERKVKEAEASLESASGRLRTAKEKNLSVLRQRLERARKSKDEKEYLEISLDTLENTLKLVRERVVAATTVQGVSASLDEVVLELGRHREHMEAVEAEFDQVERVNFELPPEHDEGDEERQRQRV